MYCIKCGTKLPDGAKFCPNCGGAVNQTGSSKTEEKKPEPEQKKPKKEKARAERPKKELKMPSAGKFKGKLPLKKLGIALGAAVVVCIVLGIIGSISENKKLHTIVAQIPDPEAFFGMSAEHTVNEEWSHKIRFETDEITLEMAEAYVELLRTNKYPFVLKYRDEDIYESTGTVWWTYEIAYTGDGELVNPHDCQIIVEHYASDTYDPFTEVTVINHTHFELVAAERYTEGGIIEPPAEQETDTSSAPSASPSPSPSASQKPQEPEVISGTIQTENEIEVPKNAVPELAAWSNGTASSTKVITTSEKHVDYKVPTGLEVIEDYIEMLQANGFTLVDEYYFSYKKDFQSWAFTCDAMPDAETIEMQYEDTPCHVCIWMSEDYDEYRIDISSSLQFFDTGVRRGGGMSNEVIAGPSAGAGLYRMPDGSYQTTDGRLSTVTGNAMVIRDGKTYTCDARWVVEGEDERLWVENYYRNEGFFMEVPKNSLMDGDVLQINNFLRERYYTTEKESLASYNWHTPFFAISYDGQWMGPVLNGTDFKALTVRLVYYQPGGEAVYYVYAELKDREPSVVEALVAVDMSGGSGGNFGNATRLSVGDTFTLNYSGEVFGSSYHVYDWKVTDGADNVRIEASGSRCRVQAEGKGIATVTVTYSYTEEEPDVLTGIMRNQRKSRSQSYNFIIE